MILIFFFFSLIIGISTVGYGNFLKNIIKVNHNSIGLTGLLGLFFLSIISSYTHIFFAHGFTHNIIVIVAGLIFFFTYKIEHSSIYKSFLIVFFLIFICLILSKNNEDFGYYHLPNSLQFAQQKLQFGVGNLNHGFKHISSLFQIMSLNYLPFFEIRLFNLTNYLFYFFLIFFLIENLILKKSTISNIGKIILLLFLILFLTKFSRLAEFGSDISGQISIILYIFFCLEILLNKNLKLKTKYEYLNFAIIFLIFAITLKFISIIYSVLLILVFFQERKKIFDYLQNIKILFFILILSSSLIFIFLNFSSTGCLIYPVENFCFTNLNWTLSAELINYLNTHYELWAKGGKGPSFEISNSNEYLSSINWIKNWFKVYFIGKFTDYLLVILTIVTITYFTFFNEFKIRKEKTNSFDYNFLKIFSCLILIFLIWFFNFPTLRYAGYTVIYIIFIFPFAIYINNKIDINSKKIFKKIVLLISISYLVFLFKNIDRINQEVKIPYDKHHNFKNFPFFWVKQVDVKKILINEHEIYKVNDACWNVQPTCVRNIDKLQVYKKNGFIFYRYE